MHIALAGPVATGDVRPLLPADAGSLPAGYSGAPLFGVLIRALLDLGHRVSAFTTDGSLDPRGPAVSVAGPRFGICYVPVRRRSFLPQGGLPGRAMDFFRLERRALAHAMLAAQPDVIHAHWTYEFALAAIATGLPHVITCHDDPVAVLGYIRHPYRLVRLLMAMAVFRRGRRFTAVSGYMQGRVQRFIPHAVHVVPNPVPPPGNELPPQAEAFRARRVAMVLNGWQRRKNPEVGIRAFARLKAEMPDASLHLYGSDFGPGEAAQRWAQARNLAAGVHFHGALPHGRLLAELAGMSVLVHPSLEESFGMIVAEAMRCGVPVVGGRESGAVPWLLGGGSAGRLADVRSADCVHAALHSLLAGQEEHLRLRQAGLERAMLFDPREVAGAYVRHYQAAMDAGPRETPAATGSRAQTEAR